MGPVPAGGSSGGWVELTIWGVPGRHVPLAVTRMGLDHVWLRSSRGLRFAKLLGTGTSATYTLRSSDPRHWALLTVWDDPEDAAQFRAGRLHRGWARLADEQLTVQMVPLTARGQWARRTPFRLPATLPPGPVAAGPVAAVTRARLRTTRMRSFWRAVPPIAQELRGHPGLVMGMSMGESPLGLMGTFSLWTDQASMSRFAHRSPAHVAAIRATGPQRWYAEELFARFMVQSAQGRYRGQPIDLQAPNVRAPQ